MCNRALSLAILIALSVFLNSRLAVVMGEIIQWSVKLVARSCLSVRIGNHFTGKGHLAVHSTPPFEPTTSLLHLQVKVQKKPQKKDF